MLRVKRPFQFAVGDTVEVISRIKEKDKERETRFRGVVISIRGRGVGRTFTVRNIGKAQVGVERIFPLFSPLIKQIRVLRRGKVRRAKLYYLRQRIGKAALYVKPAPEKKN